MPKPLKPETNNDQTNPPAEPQATPPAKAPTPEELKKQHNESVSAAMTKLYGADSPGEVEPPATAKVEPEPPKEPKQPEPPPKEEPAEPPKPVAAEPPKTEPEPPKPAPAPRRAKVEPELEEPLPEPPPKPAPVAPKQPELIIPQGLSLKPKDQYTLRVLQKMEQMNLDTAYTGIANRVTQHWANEQAWIKDWIAKHPGEKFSEDNDEYVAWTQANEPQFDDWDFEQAKTSLIKDELRAESEAKDREREKKDAEQRQARELQEAIEKAKPQLAEAAAAGVVDFIASAIPDELKPMLEVDGRRVVTKELDDAIKQADPLLREVMLEEGEELHLMLHALEIASKFPESNEAKELNKPLELKNSGETIIPMAKLNIKAFELEREFAALPAEDTNANGKAFVTQAEMKTSLNRIVDSDMEPHRKNAAIKKYFDTHWALQTEDIRAGLIQKYAQATRKKVSKIRNLVQVKKAEPKPAAQNMPPNNEPANPAPAPVKSGKPRSPAVASASDASNPRIAKGNGNEEIDKAIDSKMWGV